MRMCSRPLRSNASWRRLASIARGSRAVGGDQVQRVVLPMPFAGLRPARAGARRSCPALPRAPAGTCRRRPSRTTSPACGRRRGSRRACELSITPGLRAPALEMDAAVQCALPVVVRLALQQLAHDPARLADARLLGDRELADRSATAATGPRRTSPGPVRAHSGAAPRSGPVRRRRPDCVPSPASTASAPSRSAWSGSWSVQPVTGSQPLTMTFSSR